MLQSWVFTKHIVRLPLKTGAPSLWRCVHIYIWHIVRLPVPCIPWLSITTSISNAFSHLVFLLLEFVSLFSHEYILWIRHIFTMTHSQIVTNNHLVFPVMGLEVNRVLFLLVFSESAILWAWGLETTIYSIRADLIRVSVHFRIDFWSRSSLWSTCRIRSVNSLGWVCAYKHVALSQRHLLFQLHLMLLLQQLLHLLHFAEFLEQLWITLFGGMFHITFKLKITKPMNN